MPWLAALVCCSPYDIALHDAYGNLTGIVYGTAMDVGDVQKEPKLMEDAFRLGEKLGAGDGV